MEEERMRKISEIIAGEMRARGWDIERLSQATGVSERYLANLVLGEFKKLPALPYVRGYLARTADALDLDWEALWRGFLEESGTRREVRLGLNDEMPENRFRKKTFWRRAVVFFALAVIAGGFLFYRFFIIDNPKFSFSSPGKDGARVTTETIIVRGKVDPRYKLVFGGEEVLLDDEGKFEKEAALDSGLNVLVFKARRILGKEHEFTRQIFYEKPRNKDALLTPPTATTTETGGF